MIWTVQLDSPVQLDSTVSSVSLRLLVHGAELRGIDRALVLQVLGVTAAQLDDPDGRIPRALVYRLWEELPRLTGDESFGLWLATQTRPGAMGVIDYVARNSRTYGEALDNTVRYVRLVHDAAFFEVTHDGPHVRIAHRVAGDPSGTAPAKADWILAHLVHAGRAITGENFAASGVRLRHARPKDVKPWARHFRCVPSFDDQANELTLAREILDLPILDPDETLRELMRHFAEQKLAALPKAEGFTERLHRVVGELLTRGAPRLQEVARALGMSTRTLQRRLREVDTSYQEAVTHVRRALAERYLVERRLSVNEIAFLLGYSEPSAFHRSFKRWHRQTPLEFRDRRAG